MKGMAFGLGAARGSISFAGWEGLFPGACFALTAATFQSEVLFP